MKASTPDLSDGELSVKTSLTLKLAILQESAKCKKVIQWSGDAGLDMYILWNLPTKEVTLQTIWSRFKNFCKPQSNAVCIRFDLLTAFWQGNRNIDMWYNAVLAPIPSCQYPKEMTSIFTRNIFCFFMRDTEFITKTIQEGNTDLAQYPAFKCDRWPRSLNPAKPLANTSNSTHPAYKVLLKSMSYDITVLSYHLGRRKAVKNQTSIKKPNCSSLSNTNR